MPLVGLSPGVLGVRSVPIEEVFPVEADDVEGEATSIVSSGILRNPSEFAIRRKVVFSNNTASTAPHARVRVVSPRFRAVLFGTSVCTI